MRFRLTRTKGIGTSEKRGTRRQAPALTELEGRLMLSASADLGVAGRHAVAALAVSTTTSGTSTSTSGQGTSASGQGTSNSGQGTGTTSVSYVTDKALVDGLYQTLLN